MAKSIFVSDEYCWTASFGLFEWVIEQLLKAVDDEGALEELRLVLENDFGSIDLESLSPTGRAQILRALRTKIVPRAEAELGLDEAHDHRRLTIGHIKVLKLMAEDVTSQQGRDK
jgi:hypothetical protein